MHLRVSRGFKGALCCWFNLTSICSAGCAANERTFLSWVSMAVTMGGVSSALMGLTATSPGGSPRGALISRRTVDIITCVYVPLSLLIIVYALFTHEWRAKSMKLKMVCG